LIGTHAWGSLRWNCKPSELQQRTLIHPYRIDLNSAEHPELLQLPGVGENLARRMEDYRSQHGGFEEADDMARVRGIGPAAKERLHDWVSVEGQPPRVSDSKAESSRDRKSKNAQGTGSIKASGLMGPHININRASLADLQRLPGVGPKIAKRIFEERQKAPFESVEALRRVSGIGPKTLERLRPHVTIRSESEALRTIE
jgi:competence ComEA-like helix-hairpin-helix protein